MKKFLKIFSITLASLILLLAIVVSVLLYIVFTPERLTPIVRNQMSKFITCESRIGSVELTFFSSFPHFKIHIDDFALINPMGENCTNNELLAVQTMTAKVDIRALMRKNELHLGDISLMNGSICLFIDADGKTNFDIFPPSQDTTAFVMPFALVNISQVNLENINLTFIDKEAEMDVRLANVTGTVDGIMREMDDMDLNFDLQPFDLHYLDTKSGLSIVMRNVSGKAQTAIRTFENISATMALNSCNITYTDPDWNMIVEIENIAPTLSLTIKNFDDIRADFIAPDFLLSLNMDDEQYFEKIAVSAQGITDIVFSTYYVNFEHLIGTINNKKFTLNGSIQYDDATGNTNFNLAYNIESWEISDLLALVPPSMENLLDGIELMGQISSNGTIAGIFNGDEDKMPTVDARIWLANGTVHYPEMLPFPLHAMAGDVIVRADFTNDVNSFVQINNFRARTPQSSFSTAGRVSRLFTDPRINLTTNANLMLSEFNSMIPEELKTTASGNVIGRVHTEFILSQILNYMDDIENMPLDKMRLSGNLVAHNLDVVYDSLSVRTHHSTLEFALPNPNPINRNTSFAWANITADNLEASMIDSFSTSIQNAKMILHTSDVRDTTHIPAVYLSFISTALQAEMDSMGVSIVNPRGNVSVAPQRRRQEGTERPRFNVQFSSDKFFGYMAEENFSADKIDMNATVTYNKDEEDFFLQWMQRGAFSMVNGIGNTAMLPFPVQIPHVQMDFTPREFHIETAKLILDKSDFQLSGNLTNILAYFRNQGILTGRFELRSDFIDVNQLMALTSGIGDEEQVKTQIQETPGLPFIGPWMVPTGIDILLHTNINSALFLETTVSDISGDVQVADGTLVIGRLMMHSPGANLQLTAMHRTPNRNNLFAGVDFHILNAEFEYLLNMLPQLDTIMPMLSAFSGRGDFHLVFETFLDSMYQPRFSTMLGAASVIGTDLVIENDAMLRRVARLLRFRNRDEFRVDTLNAEFTVRRDLITVFPFLLSVDRYKMVIGGWHNLEMQFMYNASVVEGAWPWRLFGVEIDTSRPRWRQVRLARSRWPHFYRPPASTAVEDRQMQIRRNIRQALLNQVILPDSEGNAVEIQL